MINGVTLKIKYKLFL